MIRSVCGDEIPKNAASDRDKNSGGCYASMVVVVFPLSMVSWSSLSTIRRNCGGEHLWPGVYFSGHLK